ncbi:hypothetical protein Sme01_19250 [Sphaerisporangium melleum]|uniref:Integral membrane protein n=1 Tax=Sphaerisporangium melleum TaxID=321316 RepID=A0A917RDY3_9ACTN|nr:hypothetical protein [Sphaerisporangium melleum]GGL03003.1 hypothetical protein GCM10007964_51390 [Sphaerisporangium melleum]GII69449.1 hypothetical protein Sme01_19250 [Sphaerisporangium melleum]
MSPSVTFLLLLAGLSEAAGRVLPLVSRRAGTSRPATVLFLLAGAVLEGTVFALWPPAASIVAELVRPADAAALAWTPGLVAPLLLAAVLAFPLLGPLLHLLLFVGVGAGLAAPLAAGTGLGWWAAAGCVAVAGVGLGAAVEAVRRLVVTLSATEGGTREALT